jgi:SAM-dependent methyltransferase
VNAPENFSPERAADTASAAALLEMADRLGLLTQFAYGQPVSARRLAQDSGLPEISIAKYLEAMSAAAIMTEVAGGTGTFQVVPDFADIIYEAGYLSWVLNANRPFIDHVAEFFADPREAGQRYPRDLRQVAVSSQWMGSYAFYPVALSTILSAAPAHAVDLGAGTARLLIEVLRELTDSTAVALDIDGGACEEAALAAKSAGVGGRLTVTERPIQSIATDPRPVEGADVIHAGFVFHDMMPDEEDVADAVLENCRRAIRPGGFMAITDAVPYATDPRERRFSAIVTYYHQHFMGRRLLNEEEWRRKLLSVGFSSVECVRHRFPTGRFFLARK